LWRYWVASGQLERGYRLTRSALAASGERADPLWNCRALWALGQFAFRIGRYDETLQCGDRCLAIGRSIDSAESIAEGLILRGGGLHAIGELAQARSAYENARELAQTAGARFELVAATHGLAEVHRALGKLDVAESFYREAVDAARDLQDPRAAAVPLCNLARLLIASGKFERARSVLLDSLVLADAAGLKGMGEQVLDVAAGLAAKVGDAANAALFLGTASACLREAGSRRQPDDEAFIVPLLATARARLGPVAFDAAELEGTRLTYDAATRLLQRWLQNLVIADADWDPQRGEFADPASDIGKRDGFLESPVASGPGPSAVRA
jgi:tetratricopeptide (TPR) repeat protein